MAYTGQIPGRQRAMAMGGAWLVALGIGLGLASGLDLGVIRLASEAITAIALPAPPPRHELIPKTAPTKSASGKPSTANRHAKAAPVAASEPKLPSFRSPQVVAAPNPGSGSDSSAGATVNPGAGSGAGGIGNGTGAGGSGRGTGGGTKAVLQSGAIADADYPREAARAKTGGDVEVRFTILASGRVGGCRVTRSSGDAALDAATCRLIEARFRFKPATNAAGQPVASEYGWRQSWWLEKRR